MRYRWFSLTGASLVLGWSLQAQAVSDQQYDSIRALGELNGVALHCKFINETRRMKRALVLALTKRKQLGDAFDSFTNDSFLAFIQENAECPEEAKFAVEVDKAIIALDAAFAKQQ